jgi:hypothetical protein
MPAGNHSAPAARIKRLLLHRVGGKSQLRPDCDGPGRLTRLTGLPPILAAVLIIAALTASAKPQTNVTLAWDPSPGSDIAGYRLYVGCACRTYTNVIDQGNVTSATVFNLVNGATYFLAVTAYDTDGLESGFSDEICYTVPWPTNYPPALTLTSPANGAAYREPATLSLTAEVTANGHIITEVQFYNGTTLLGAATSTPYSFSWNDVCAGTYSLSAQVVYDLGSTVTSEPVNVIVPAGKPGSGLPFAPDPGTMTSLLVETKGTLSQSVTTSVTNGDETTPLRIKIKTAAGAGGGLNESAQIAATSVILSATGQPGGKYDVLCTHDFRTWTLIGTLTLDASGSGDFTEPVGNSRPNCFYRLQGQEARRPAYPLPR